MASADTLRVLLISHQFHPHIGGYEKAAASLAVSLVHRGVYVEVVTFTPNRSDQSDKERPYRVHRLPSANTRFLSTLTATVALLIFLLRNRHRFDVWHCFSLSPACLVAMSLVRSLRVAKVVRLQSTGEEGIGNLARAGFFGKIGLLKRAVSSFGRIVALTTIGRDEALAFGVPAQRISIVPNSVDTEKFKPAGKAERDQARRVLGLPLDRTIALQVCRLDPAKDLPHLLAVWRTLQSSCGEQPLLVIVGDGPLKQALHGIVQDHGLAHSVRLVGHYPDTSIWYQAADFYVLSSLHEGMSNSLLEAMASALPIVSTDVSGSEIVLTKPGAGIVVPAGDGEEMKQALEQIIVDPTMRARCGAAGRDRMIMGYSLRQICEQHLEIYREVTGDRVGTESKGRRQS